MAAEAERTRQEGAAKTTEAVEATARAEKAEVGFGHSYAMFGKPPPLDKTVARPSLSCSETQAMASQRVSECIPSQICCTAATSL
jgi:hypothetical protein